MTEKNNSDLHCLLLAAFQFVFYDSLEEYENARLIICRRKQNIISNDTIISTESNADRIMFQNQEQIDDYIDKFWKFSVDVLRLFKEKYGYRASEKKKIFTEIENILDSFRRS